MKQLQGGYVMDGYAKCDRCSARALREFTLDNGLNLYACLHHAAQWAPSQPQDVRFNLEPMTLGGYLGADALAYLDEDLSINA